MGRREPYRHWPGYVRDVALWLLIAVGVSIATVLGIFKGIALVMDYFLMDDRFYEGFAVSVFVSACGTVILFAIIFVLVRRISMYPRRRFKGIRGT